MASMADDSPYSFSWSKPPAVKSLVKIKRPKLDIIGDPADQFRGDKGSITKGDYSGMLAYDKSLYEPGTASMVRSGDALPAVPSYAQGWQAPTSRAGLAAIESRYHGSGSAHGPNAGLEADRAAGANVPGAPEPTMEQMADANAAMTNIANPNLPGGPEEVSSNPNLEAGRTSGANPAGPVTNPHTGGEVSSLQNWMNAGGSLHTFHNKQVAQGLRPAIDGRATVSPQEGMNGNAGIRAGWGWEPENFGQQGSELIAGGGSAGDAQRKAQQAALIAQQQQRLNQAQAQVSAPVSAYSNAQ